MTGWKTLFLTSLAMTLMAGMSSAQEKKDSPDGRDRSAGHQRMRDRMSQEADAPKAGDLAPTFKLTSLDGKQVTDLASFKGSRPVVLFFGSYT